MAMPGFIAEASRSARARYGGRSRIAETPAGSVVPAIPYCGNCDYILDRCASTRSHSAIETSKV